jgi:ribose transport system substrate-binding protein
MTQKTQFMGKLAVDTALAMAAGKSEPAQQLQEAVLTTKANVAPFITKHP